MSYQLEETQEFRKGFDKLPFAMRMRFEKQLRKVVENPYGFGRPLGKRWFRELKQKEIRLYYYIYEDRSVVLLVAVSDKDNQQEAIDKIREFVKRGQI